MVVSELALPRILKHKDFKAALVVQKRLCRVQGRRMCRSWGWGERRCKSSEVLQEQRYKLFVVPQITDECNLYCQRYGDHLEVEFLGSAGSDRSPLRAELWSWDTMARSYLPVLTVQVLTVARLFWECFSLCFLWTPLSVLPDLTLMLFSCHQPCLCLWVWGICWHHVFTLALHLLEDWLPLSPG